MECGYGGIIERRTHFDIYGIDTEWVVIVTRLSDGEKLIRTFKWGWRARRFANSTRRLSKAFEKEAQIRAERYTRFEHDMS